MINKILSEIEVDAISLIAFSTHQIMKPLMLTKADYVVYGAISFNSRW